jgi:hypothetical protein
MLWLCFKLYLYKDFMTFDILNFKQENFQFWLPLILPSPFRNIFFLYFPKSREARHFCVVCMCVCDVWHYLVLNNHINFKEWQDILKGSQFYVLSHHYCGLVWSVWFRGSKKWVFFIVYYFFQTIKKCWKQGICSLLWSNKCEHFWKFLRLETIMFQWCANWSSGVSIY